YGVAAFSFVTFLPCSVRPIVKPGPTVPVTVFGVAADPLPVATNAAAPIAATSTDVRVIVLISFASSRSGSETGSSSAGVAIRTVETPWTLRPAPAVQDRISDLGDYEWSLRRCLPFRWPSHVDFLARGW